MKTKRLLIAGCLAAFIMPMSALAGNVAAGKEKSVVCAACHGQTGQSVSPDFPNLGGQHGDYLYRALLDYKAGYRKNPIMSAQVESLSKADMADLAAYFAAQSGLSVKR
ncbi:MAG TPA: cytochrome c [Denitromonas sp.]|uniref:c-type cytochrome n=1 Tax=Denitromonas sp. TaxID=2734609 RepID=UPI001DC339C0|nr:cytochrome c [Rhodocyclaceae bacterium]MCP5220797.1 cytochrome c [Zoogloeaceae bacterium]HPR07014.1 cytochrome c [Denitromonas sp.]HQU88821.1 cytochrome c [Denitromonas sp.]HQV15020.1 cytochrome c [Denitromonas sp.]